MSTNFNKYIQDGEQFIREVATAAGAPDDIAKGGRFLRAVLHAFRRLLPPNESLNLISQFPMLIKAVYVDGWKISTGGVHIRHLGDFIESVREEGGVATKSHFTTDYEVEQAIHAVFCVLKKHVSEGEIKDVLATMPEELRHFLANREKV